MKPVFKEHPLRKHVQKHLELLRTIQRHKYHPLIHKLRTKFGISKKTLFYVKEYGPHSNVPKTIIRESIKVLLFASLLSSLGGLALEHIKVLFVSILPLVILFPALNDMIGDYGIIISSRFSTLLHTGKIKRKWRHNLALGKLFTQIFIVSILTAILSSIIALALSSFSTDYHLTLATGIKVFLIGIIDVVLLVNGLFFISIIAGLHYFRKKEDPNNFLIPIATSVADFGNLIILSILIKLFFF